MAGTAGPGGQQFTGAGTIPVGGFVGVGASFIATTPGLTQVPVTLQFILGPSKSDVLDQTVSFLISDSRNHSVERWVAAFEREIQGRH